MSVAVCYRPMDVLTARGVITALRNAGIKAEMRRFHNPWEISWLEGNPWGEILVLEKDLEKAREVVKDFLKSTGKA